jgi:hypothetical protein
LDATDRELSVGSEPICLNWKGLNCPILDNGVSLPTKGIRGAGMNRLLQLEEKGFSVVADVFSRREMDNLTAELSGIIETEGVRRRGEIYAIRNLLEACPAVKVLAESAKVSRLVSAILGDNAFPVRGLLFDKIVGANWLLPWHQDMTICVAERHDVPGYGPWSIKAGEWHVHPPTTVLERMLSADTPRRLR